MGGYFGLDVSDNKRTISCWLQEQLNLAVDSYFFYIGFLLEDP